MGNRPQSSPPGYSVTISKPEFETKLSPSPSHFPSTSAGSRFPSPQLLQPNQIPSPSIKTPNLPSPGNGIRTAGSVPYLSTPPGPPVFSSPLQPAAVPVSTSPATPQPLVFASGFSLPMSSSPLYSNGSAELQQQISDVAEELAHALDSPNVLFSAHKVLKQKKLANVPSLWFGALVSPGQEVSAGPQIIQREPHRCHTCGAYSNLYCNILLGSGQWQCVICRNLNGSDGEYIASSKEELRNLPEISSPLVDYVQTGNKTPGFIPVSDSRMTAPIILIIDECLDEPHLRHLQSSLHAFVDSLPPTTRLQHDLELCFMVVLYQYMIFQKNQLHLLMYFLVTNHQTKSL